MPFYSSSSELCLEDKCLLCCKMGSLYILGYFLISIAFTCAEEDSDITKFMKHLEVIPDVIDVGPKNYLEVTYTSNIKADKGVELTPTQVKDKPKIEWKADKSTFYTLIMTDPDAPSRNDPKFREWHHWLVVNIPGNAVEKGEQLSEYIGAGPPKDTGLHRYVFLLYRQPKKLSFDEPRLKNNSGENRGKFSVRKFVQKYGLGDPIAGNFFQAQWDDYVPKLYAQLGA